jgi:hypothetical protein
MKKLIVLPFFFLLVFSISNVHADTNILLNSEQNIQMIAPCTNNYFGSSWQWWSGCESPYLLYARVNGGSGSLDFDLTTGNVYFLTNLSIGYNETPFNSSDILFIADTNGTILNSVQLNSGNYILQNLSTNLNNSETLRFGITTTRRDRKSVV